MADSSLQFWLNDRLVTVPSGVPGATTLLRFLRDHLGMTGTKEGCGEGDCGACSVAVLSVDYDGLAEFQAINACLVFLPMVHNKRVYTVEGLRDQRHALSDPPAGYHPAQQVMVETRASQCGFCTPGIVMSLFEACYRGDIAPGDVHRVEEQLAGNLCRCTGYRPIREAGLRVAGSQPDDRFRRMLEEAEPEDLSLDWRGGGQLYLQPASLAALWEARARYPRAQLVAGGTDLALEVTKQHRSFPQLISLEAIPTLQLLKRIEGGWRVGAGVSINRLQRVVGPSMPGLEKMLHVFGARQIRHRATVGGNLCNASPIGDLAPVLLALGATAIIAGPEGERRLAMERFFEAYRVTALGPDEILLAVELPELPEDVFFSTYKVSKRRELDISAVAAGLWLRLQDGVVQELRLAFGGVAATPVRASQTEAALQGVPWTEASVQAALEVLAQELHPISDHRGSAAYRQSLASNLLLGFFLESQGGSSQAVVEERPSASVLPPALPPL